MRKSLHACCYCIHCFDLQNDNSCLFHSDPILNTNSNERSTVQMLLEKLILEEDQFDVHDILPNTVPDPASLILESDYACPVGQVVMAPDCGKPIYIVNYDYNKNLFFQYNIKFYHIKYVF